MSLWNDVQAEDFGEEDTMSAMVEMFGVDMVKQLVEAFGGDAIYIPKMETVVRSARNRRIRQQFTGSNYRDLAHEHNLTTRRVRHILEK